MMIWRNKKGIFNEPQHNNSNNNNAHVYGEVNCKFTNKHFLMHKQQFMYKNMIYIYGAFALPFSLPIKSTCVDWYWTRKKIQAKNGNSVERRMNRTPIIKYSKIRNFQSAAAAAWMHFQINWHQSKVIFIYIYMNFHTFATQNKDLLHSSFCHYQNRHDFGRISYFAVIVSERALLSW